MTHKGMGIKMKISRNEFERIYNPKLNKNSSQTKKEVTTTESGDKIELSNGAKEYSVIKGFIVSAAKEATKTASMERLMDLKKAVSNGTYEVSSETVADAIVK